MMNKLSFIILSGMMGMVTLGTVQAVPSATTLYSFNSSNSGSYYPAAGLTMNSTGSFYGTTSSGGINGYGTVFSLTPPNATVTTWQYSDISSFAAGKDGASPTQGRLVMDAKGALYGTTTSGGTANLGTVYQLLPPDATHSVWLRKTIFSFSGTTTGKNPAAGLVIDSAGVLYGTASAGGTYDRGVVFMLTPASTSFKYKVLHNFAGASTDGGGLNSGVVIDSLGNLFGTTSFGGTHNNGTIFELVHPIAPSTTWKFSTVYNFSAGNDGDTPGANLTMGPGNVVYGINSNGGNYSSGTLFSLQPSGKTFVFNVLHHFTGGIQDGANPYGDLIIDASGTLYGTTNQGGTNGTGTVFKLSPPGSCYPQWLMTVLYNLNGSSGYYPHAGLVMDNMGILYGVGYYGGTNGAGAIFKVSP